MALTRGLTPKSRVVLQHQQAACLTAYSSSQRTIGRRASSGSVPRTSSVGPSIRIMRAVNPATTKSPTTSGMCTTSVSALRAAAVTTRAAKAGVASVNDADSRTEAEAGLLADVVYDDRAQHGGHRSHGPPARDEQKIRADKPPQDDDIHDEEVAPPPEHLQRDPVEPERGVDVVSDREQLEVDR